MLDLKISQLPLYTGDTTGFYTVVNDSSESVTYKVVKDTITVVPNSGIVFSGGTQSLETLYNTTMGDSVTTPNALGGIPAGTTAASLKTQSIVSIIDELLFPAVAPTLNAGSYSLGTSLSSVLEVGTSVSNTLTGYFNRGSITQPWSGNSFQNYRYGIASQYTFSGTGLVGTTTQVGTTLTFSYNITLGSNSWSSTVTYGAGPQPVNNFGANSGSPASAGTLTNGTTINGVYPFIYGMSATDYTSSGDIYSALTKLIQGKQNTSVNYNAADQYVYFAYPASYGNLTSVVDWNSFDITSNFTKFTININGGSLWSSISYNIYRAPITTIPNKSITFNF